jgi:radical SAM superfamily enzyme YgiQ (UPF0313 family)
MVDLKSYYSSPAYQLGLLVAYATLEAEVKENVKFTFIEFTREQPAKEIADVIMAAGADLVNASNYAWNYKKLSEVLEILTKSQARLPRIVLGGPNSAGTFGANMMKRYPIISTMVEGEGEPAFRDICSSMVDSPIKDPFINSRNCVVRDQVGDILSPNLGHRIRHLDEVPSPYLTGILSPRPSPVFYETNRGCPYRCGFCYWGNGNSKVYQMSSERIYEEMEFFAKNKVSSFWLADANFGIFKSDAEIADKMCEINARHGYPFKHVGVNWAKNSSDRVLDIASIFKQGRMGCTTTLAIQSVTPEAEDKSKRYSMNPSKFATLISSAHEREIDTYTDIIWGLPGEDVEEYINGLDAVISTGVPAILVHQLYLLPGTEFYDKREELGLTMLSEAGGTTVDPSERSDYWDYIVVRHPKMSREDMIRGARIVGINHLLHNHDLGKVVNFYLGRYGISHREVYNFLDEVLLGKVDGFTEEKEGFLNKLRDLILTFANNVGIDEYIFYRTLSDLVWFKRDEKGHRECNEPEVRSFMQDFYKAFCRKHAIYDEPEAMNLISDIVDYNVLISPKPAWKPNPTYSFKYDVHAIWQSMLKQIHSEGKASSGTDTAYGKVSPIEIDRQNQRNSQEWSNRARNVRTRVANLLSNEYLENMIGPVTYRVKNPWHFPPSQLNSDWLLSSGSKHCIVIPVK